MAEGMIKQFYGKSIYSQSAGVKNDLEIDGFAIAVCAEIGVELSRHKTRSFDDMIHLGDDISNFELIIINDGSTDATSEKVKLFNDKRIKLIETKGVGKNK